MERQSLHNQKEPHVCIAILYLCPTSCSWSSNKPGRLPLTMMMMMMRQSQLHYWKPGGYFRRRLSPLQNVDKHIPFKFPLDPTVNKPSLATQPHQFTMLSHNYSTPNYWVTSACMCVSSVYMWVCICFFLAVLSVWVCVCRRRSGMWVEG